jgi:hypothetical protein
MMRNQIERLKKESERRPLCWQEIKVLKIFARDFPEAQELLQKCPQVGQKSRKSFRQIVKETPRRKRETCVSWVRRIWDECANYDTKCPEVLTEELLEKLSKAS